MKEDLGYRIKKRRKELKLTQKELATGVNVSSQVISNWERGYTTPNSDDIERLVKVLKISSDELMNIQPVIIDTDAINELLGYTLPSKKEPEPEKEPLDEINRLIKEYGIEQMGFFDLDKWKKLTPEDIKIIEEHFKMIVKIAEERNKED